MNTSATLIKAVTEELNFTHQSLRPPAQYVWLVTSSTHPITFFVFAITLLQCSRKYKQLNSHNLPFVILCSAIKMQVLFLVLNYHAMNHRKENNVFRLYLFKKHILVVQY